MPRCLSVMRMFIVMFIFGAAVADAQGPFASRKKLAEQQDASAARRQLLAPRMQIVRLPVAGNVLPELRGEDVVRMKLDGVAEEFAREFRCDVTVDDGAITVPLIGRVRATGLAPAQVAKSIERELIAKKLFTAPKVSLERIGWVPFVTICGDVRAPGRVYWVPGLTLLAVHAAAGGPAGWQNDDFTITRAGNVTRYSLKQIRGNPKLEPKLEPGDVVEVSGEF
jgi:protein involved in polysaccharide export with SLBB domain